MNADVKKDLVIHIDGKTYHPLRKILAKDELLELAGLEPRHHKIFLVDSESTEHQIESNEGLELQDGMEFKVRGI